MFWQIIQHKVAKSISFVSVVHIVPSQIVGVAISAYSLIVSTQIPVVSVLAPTTAFSRKIKFFIVQILIVVGLWSVCCFCSLPCFEGISIIDIPLNRLVILSVFPALVDCHASSLLWLNYVPRSRFLISYLFFGCTVVLVFLGRVITDGGLIFFIELFSFIVILFANEIYFLIEFSIHFLKTVLQFAFDWHFVGIFLFWQFSCGCWP